MSAIQRFVGDRLDEVGKRMFGVDDVTRLCLIALYTDGHILLEGNPGLGKTELIKTLGKALRLPFGRIQFTPDLMPSDITGTYMPDLDSPPPQKLVFNKGPVFTSLLLADEINRATPKTQAAMLEAMAERQVTVLGNKMPIEAPFMVLATQNPIDHEGTYSLPEAQADRFMFKATMPIPDGPTLQNIVNKCASDDHEEAEGEERPLSPNVLEKSRKACADIRKRIRRVAPLPLLETHIRNMFLASNHRFGELEDLGKRQTERARRLVSELMLYGMGPRAAIAMMNGAKAWTLLFSRGSDNADGPALARVVIPVLRHRIKLNYDWEERYLAAIKSKGIDRGGDWLLERLIADFCIHTAPDRHGYPTTVKGDAGLASYAGGGRW